MKKLLHIHGSFLQTNIKVNALFKKACFSKQQHYFYIRKVSFKILKKKML